MSRLFLDLLKKIADGVTIYEPLGRTPDEMHAFQDTLQRLQEMERQRLIRRLFTQTRSAANGEYIDFAMVQGGITAEGERLLQEHAGQTEQQDASRFPTTGYSSSSRVKD